VKARLAAVPADSAVGALRGTRNLVSFTTPALPQGAARHHRPRGRPRGHRRRHPERPPAPGGHVDRRTLRAKPPRWTPPTPGSRLEE
jgi:hypothetical protein